MSRHPFRKSHPEIYNRNSLTADFQGRNGPLVFIYFHPFDCFIRGQVLLTYKSYENDIVHLIWSVDYSFPIVTADKHLTHITSPLPEGVPLDRIYPHVPVGISRFCSYILMDVNGVPNVDYRSYGFLGILRDSVQVEMECRDVRNGILRADLIVRSLDKRRVYISNAVLVINQPIESTTNVPKAAAFQCPRMRFVNMRPWLVTPGNMRCLNSMLHFYDKYILSVKPKATIGTDGTDCKAKFEDFDWITIVCNKHDMRVRAKSLQCPHGHWETQYSITRYRGHSDGNYYYWPNCSDKNITDDVHDPDIWAGGQPAPLSSNELLAMMRPLHSFPIYGDNTQDMADMLEHFEKQRHSYESEDAMLTAMLNEHRRFWAEQLEKRQQCREFRTLKQQQTMRELSAKRMQQQQLEKVAKLQEKLKRQLQLDTDDGAVDGLLYGDPPKDNCAGHDGDSPFVAAVKEGQRHLNATASSTAQTVVQPPPDSNQGNGIYVVTSAAAPMLHPEYKKQIPYYGLSVDEGPHRMPQLALGRQSIGHYYPIENQPLMAAAGGPHQMAQPPVSWQSIEHGHQWRQPPMAGNWPQAFAPQLMNGYSGRNQQAAADQTQHGHPINNNEQPEEGVEQQLLQQSQQNHQNQPECPAMQESQQPPQVEQSEQEEQSAPIEDIEDTQVPFSLPSYPTAEKQLTYEMNLRKNTGPLSIFVQNLIESIQNKQHEIEKKLRHYSKDSLQYYEISLQTDSTGQCTFLRQIYNKFVLRWRIQQQIWAKETEGRFQFAEDRAEQKLKLVHLTMDMLHDLDAHLKTTLKEIVAHIDQQREFFAQPQKLSTYSRQPSDVEMPSTSQQPSDVQMPSTSQQQPDEFQRPPYDRYYHRPTTSVKLSDFLKTSSRQSSKARNSRQSTNYKKSSTSRQSLDCQKPKPSLESSEIQNSPTAQHSPELLKPTTSLESSEIQNSPTAQQPPELQKPPTPPQKTDFLKSTINEAQTTFFRKSEQDDMERAQQEHHKFWLQMHSKNPDAGYTAQMEVQSLLEKARLMLADHHTAVLEERREQQYERLRRILTLSLMANKRNTKEYQSLCEEAKAATQLPKLPKFGLILGTQDMTPTNVFYFEVNLNEMDVGPTLNTEFSTTYYLRNLQNNNLNGENNDPFDDYDPYEPFEQFEIDDEEEYEEAAWVPEYFPAPQEAAQAMPAPQAPQAPQQQEQAWPANDLADLPAESRLHVYRRLAIEANEREHQNAAAPEADGAVDGSVQQ